jgi:O-antigen/teichoic acid export membrane protein
MLAKNSLLTLVANLSFAFTNWLLIVVLAKMNDAQFLGQFVLTLSVVSPIFLFFSLKLRTLLVVDLENEYSLEQYLGTRLIASSIALLVVLILGASFFKNVPLSLFLIIGTFKCFDALSELFYAYYHRSGHFMVATLSQSARSLLCIAAIFLCVYLDTTPLGIIIGWVATSSLFCLVDTVIFTQFRKKKDGVQTAWLQMFNLRFCYYAHKQIFKKYYTLSISLMVGALFVYIPNFVLEKYVGIKAAGQFAAVSYFLVAGGLLINSVSQASAPKLSALVKANDWHNFASLTLKMCSVGATIGLAGIIVAYLFGHFFLLLFYNANIAQLSTELVWILTAAAIRYIYIFIGTAMNSLKQFNTQTNIYLVGTVSVLVISLILVPMQGTLGAAKAMVIATSIECVLFIFFFWKKRYKGQQIND